MSFMLCIAIFYSLYFNPYRRPTLHSSQFGCSVDNRRWWQWDARKYECKPCGMAWGWLRRRSWTFVSGSWWGWCEVALVLSDDLRPCPLGCCPRPLYTSVISTVK